MTVSKWIILTCLINFLLVVIANAQEAPAGGTSAEELAKKLSNPVASLISVSFQNNTDYGSGPNNGSKNVLNFQPVIPIILTPKLNLIARVILPIVSQRDITDPGTSQSGLSDITATAFFAPSQVKNGLIWAVGPAFLIPTGTNTYLGTGKFGIGPSGLILKQTGSLTFGVLANQIWSVIGNSGRTNVNQMFIQPFFTNNWKSGAGLGINAEMTQNWKASTFTAFLNPLGFGRDKTGKSNGTARCWASYPGSCPGRSKTGFWV